MIYIMLPDLYVIHFFVCPIRKNFQKVFMDGFAIGYIIINSTIIIPDLLPKAGNYMEIKVI